MSNLRCIGIRLLSLSNAALILNDYNHTYNRTKEYLCMCQFGFPTIIEIYLPAISHMLTKNTSREDKY